jgi:hypothetical protein
MGCAVPPGAAAIDRPVTPSTRLPFEKKIGPPFEEPISAGQPPRRAQSIPINVTLQTLTSELLRVAENFKL